MELDTVQSKKIFKGTTVKKIKRKDSNQQQIQPAPIFKLSNFIYSKRSSVIIFSDARKRFEKWRLSFRLLKSAVKNIGT